MTDDPGTHVPEPPSGPSASEAWKDVVARMSELGAAVSHWAREAADDPENRQRVEQLRVGVNDMAKKADAAFSQAMGTDLGQQVQQGAEQAGKAIGDAAQQVSQAAAPHVASAFSGLADAFGRAAAKVNQAATRDGEPEAPASSPSAEPPADNDQG